MTPPFALAREFSACERSHFLARPRARASSHHHRRDRFVRSHRERRRARAPARVDRLRLLASASASVSPLAFDDDDVAMGMTSTSTRDDGTTVATTSKWLRGDARVVEELKTVVVGPVNALERAMGELSENELREKTKEFRERLKRGETMDDVLVEAFAVVREASRRELGLRHFDVQLIGGALLHRGWVAEMRTGEGKTLVATLPAYLNALEGRGVHVVTVNDYLAERDATEMGRIHRYLGLTVGVIQSGMDPEDRKEAYACDITYVTNTEVGFDYLRDNMATEAEELVVLTRPFNFAIVDEVDSVLIDEGRNPLLITGPGDVNDNDRYETAAKVAEKLVLGRDYKVVLKEKSAELTEEGMVRAEAILGVDDLWDAREPWGKYILLAVKAKSLFIKDVDYIVREGEVIIVDPSTGRVQLNRRWNDNLHQAVEAKEGVEVNGENSIIASISYQCLFKLYKKLSGMTGTASTESEEFFSTYELRVARVPTNKPNLRVDAPTALFMSAEARWNAVADFIASCHHDGRPVLVGTTSVENSETLSTILDEYLWRSPDGRVIKGIPHELLNARPQYAAREANIIAQAGRQYAVTIATNMAGRGTDILLGGSPEGLAKHTLVKKLWPALGFEDSDEEALLLFAELSTLAKQALEQAVMVARAARAMAGDMELEQAEEIITEALFDAGERLRRDMEETNASEGESPFLRAIKTAAFAVLRDCSVQCSAERDVVRKLGGLQVIGTSLHDSRRIDNQLRGRAGRQGDLGSTAFFISAEDDLLQTYCPGWGSDKLWMFAGIDMDMPIYSDIVDKQLEAVQKQIEDYLSSHRESTFESDRVLDRQREAVYKLRRQILLSGQQPLRERLFKYMGQIVDNACERAGVAGNINPNKWNYQMLLDELRHVFIGRRDRWLDERGQPLSTNPHYLPGVDAAQIMESMVRDTPPPVSRELPPLSMNAAVVKAAISGVEIVLPEDQDPGPSVADTEPEAAPEALAARLIARLSPEAASDDADPAYVKRWNKGWHAYKARKLRSYLTEAAVQMYLDRFARLTASENYDRTSLEDVERLWALRAIDKLWQRHLVQMEVLRTSVQVRSFGHLEPRDEFRIDGAKAFVSLVESIREEMIKNIFYFVGASVEPIVDFDAEENSRTTEL